MSLTRRRLFQQLATLDNSAQHEWVSARGREAGLMEYGEQGMSAGGMKPVRIASNENPVGPGQHVLDALVGKFPEAHRYPFNARQTEGALITAIAQKFQAKGENVLLGPGSGDILTHAVRAFTSASKPLVTAWPSFENPRDTAKKIGSAVKEVALDDKLRIDINKMVEASKGAGLVFFCNPNNPTATVHGKSTVADMVKQIRAASPDTVILIDEAYHDYVTDPSYQSAIDIALTTPNVFVTRTFSKAYGMAGLRAGYAIGHAPTIKSIAAFKMPYGLGTLVLGGAIVGFGNQAYIDGERKRNTDVKAFTVKAFTDMGFTGTDSQTNFVFMNLKRPAAGFRDACRAAGVMVGRDFPPYEKTHCRISLGTMDEMKRAVDVFKKVLGNTTSTAAKDGI
jgi:histidinol-phosphate aminotransferase